MKKTLLTFLCVGLVLIGYGQERIVSGRVTSADDQSPMPGVNIVLKGSTVGTVTDGNGSYRLSVPSDETVLVFSFIGMLTQEAVVGTRSTIDIALVGDLKELAEVVVTAQSIERSKAALGYSIATVGNEKLTQISEPDPLRSMSGKIAGVNIIGSSGLPGSSTRITIRGNSSLTGSNQPLFVVDGIPYDNSYTASGTTSALVGGGAPSNRAVDIDPANVESMTVLKGASAAALYGTRAANGVILITTKTGSSKALNKGFEMTLNSSYSLDKIANLPDLQNTYGSGANGNYGAVNGSYGAPFGGRLKTLPHPYWGAAYQSAFPQFQGVRVPYEAYPNNVSDFFNTGYIAENSLSVSSGTEKGRLTAVISRTNQSGMIPHSEFTRTSISMGGSAKLDNKFTVGGTVTYTNTDQAGPILGANNAIGGASIFGRTLWLPRNLDLTGLPYKNPVTNASVAGWLTGQIDNPYWSAENNQYTSMVDRVNGNVTLGYDINPWLKANYRGGINTYNDRRETIVRPGSVSSQGGTGLGGIETDYVWWQELESNLTLTMNKQLNEQLSLAATIGHGINQRTTKRQIYSGAQFVAFGIDDPDNVQTLVPAGGSYSQQRIVGAYGDVQLGYRDMLYVNLSGRNDWASTLPKNGNSFFYPAASASFVFTELLDVSDNVISFGKVRIGAAKVGNAPTAYNLVPTYTINPGYGNVSQGLGVAFPILGRPGAQIGATIADANLKPEFTSEIEAGAEMRFFNNRVGFDATWYRKTTTNQLGFVSVPSVTGYTSKYTNFGEVRNEGVEVAFNATPVRIRDFQWNVSAAFTHNDNRVIRLADGVDIISVGGGFAGGVRSVHTPGRAYGSIDGTPVARDPETDKLLINEVTGFPMAMLTRDIIGNPNPKFLLGVTNTFSFRGLSLSVLFDMRYGGDIFSSTMQNMIQRGATTDTEDREKMVIVDGYLGDPSTLKTRYDAEGQPLVNNTMINANSLFFTAFTAEEFYIFDATTYRLREASLSYNLPKTFLSKTPFGSARVSVSGRNLWLYTPNLPKGTNFDPETSTFGASNLQGFEYTNAPTARRYGVNISLTF